MTAAWHTCRRHWLLGVLLMAGATLRVLTWLAYQPALLYYDSFRYLENLDALRPDLINPIGYSLLLHPLLAVGDLSFVAAVQHLLGLGIAVALYALALRLTVPRWLAALVAAVVLLDAYQLQIEQNILSEVWFQALLVGVLWVLLGRGVPSWKRAAVAGALLGLAVIVRVIGGTIIVPVVLYLLLIGVSSGGLRRGILDRERWKRAGRRAAGGLLGFAVVLGSYAVYFHAVTGGWGITGASTQVLYGRTATFADCAELDLSHPLDKFCPDVPVEDRPGVDYYTHYVYGEPGWPAGVSPEAGISRLATEFGRTVLANQPLDFAGEVLGDFAKYFTWTKFTWPDDVPIDRWQFQLDYPRFGDWDPAAYARTYGDEAPAVHEGLAGFLRLYQLTIGYTPGPVLGLAAAFGLVAGAGIGRARGSGLRSAALLSTGAGLTILLGSVAFEFSWRYELPVFVLLPLGGAIGLTALLGLGKSTGSRRRKLATYPDEVDAPAAEAFHQRYGRQALSPVTVVIAAYNEAGGIGGALRNMPAHCGDLPVSVLVVVDGASDDTAAVAEHNGAFVCVAGRNRGQGAALRLGYHLAADAGARYVVTTDADGQYDNGELPLLLEPLLDGTADFTTGSRRLGSEQADSRMRWLGVRVFAALASVLTRRKITDTSFGFRAMRAEVACSVTLREPQYQSSELLLGVLARGARVLEVPMSMRLRAAGVSKKGRSLRYGLNYARVMLGTWFRAYLLRR